jgi:hypothetical protein
MSEIWTLKELLVKVQKEEESYREQFHVFGEYINNHEIQMAKTILVVAHM